MNDIPDNNFRIFYDHEAKHYRVLVDGYELTNHIAAGGIKVDFSKIEELWDLPEITLTFHAAGGVEIVLPNGEVIDGSPKGEDES